MANTEKSKQTSLLLLTLTLTTMTFSGCSKEESGGTSKDLDGYCGYAFVRDYNEVIYETREYKKTLETAEMSSVEAYNAAFDLRIACGAFKEKHKIDQCNAMSNTDGKTLTVTPEDLKNNCEPANTLVDAKVKNKALPEKPNFTPMKDQLLDVANPNSVN